MILKRGVPYWIGGGMYVEDRFDACIPDHTTMTLQRAYVLPGQPWQDPWRFLVLEAVSGKIYRVSREAWWHSLIFEGGPCGEMVKQDRTDRMLEESPSAQGLPTSTRMGLAFSKN